MLLVDGQTFDGLDLGHAISKCKEDGPIKDEDIIVDILLCFDKPIDIEPWTYEEAKEKTAKQIYERRKEIKVAYSYLEDVNRVMRHFPHVSYRYVLQPS